MFVLKPFLKVQFIEQTPKLKKSCVIYTLYTKTITSVKEAISDNLANT